MIQFKNIYFGNSGSDNNCSKKAYQSQEIKSETFCKKNKSKVKVNQILNQVVFFIILFVLSGCSKWLDIKPESEIILDEYWKSESEATAVVAACYKRLTEYDCMSRMILLGEGRSDNVIPYSLKPNDDNDLRKIVENDITAANGFCKWGAFYTVINYCNTFLHYAPNVLKEDKNFTQAKLNALSAEVYTIRALAYFYLVRIYQNVPWIGEPSIDDLQDYNVPQSSESVIIEHIISDLKTALLTAPSAYNSVAQNKGRVTKNAVRALLADVYLWDMQYGDCVEMCNELLSGTELKLVDTKNIYWEPFYKVFGIGNSTESIFELQFGNADDNKEFNTVAKDYYGNWNTPNSKLSFSPHLAMITSLENPLFNRKVGSSIESEKDIRYKDFFMKSSYTDLIRIFKYAGVYREENAAGTSSLYSFRTTTANWIIYRLSDVMLMRAEALIQLNRSEADLREALRMVNITYLRSNPDLVTDSLVFENYQSPDILNKLVLRERQREFLFEGKRWFDLMRQARRIGKVSPVIDYVSRKPTSNYDNQISAQASMDALYLPVNQDDMDANPKLIQNPYYELINNSSK